ncbi:uncharacterized protein TNIN_38271 [Trichonephila inaurata madagascariensis]|uniref:Transposase n=1 Tax=Trichonephila inaurata madagascariensis TaxID=2747483 RepID=A0A8X6Y6N0_9ARAC|nr:uncharacterized protein TNIN_38271 [Trichonephila inaurata madagascariensis]
MQGTVHSSKVDLPEIKPYVVEYQLEHGRCRRCGKRAYAEDTTDEDLRDIAEKSPIIKLAYDELDKFRWNEKDLIAYEERIMDLRKEEAILAQKLDDATQKGRQEGRQEGIQIGHEKGREEGKQEGREEGEKQAKIAVAKNLLKAGVSVDLIAESTGLPQAEIMQLKEEISQ